MSALGSAFKRFFVMRRRKAWVRRLDHRLVWLHEAIENRNYDSGQNGEWRVLDVVRQRHSVSTVLDVGANVGDWTVHAAGIFPDAKVFSLEIVESTYAELLANSAAHRNVSAHNLGLSDKSGEIEIFCHEEYSFLATAVEGSLEALFGMSTRPVKCWVMTGDEFCAAHGITHIDVLKIDVEGMEDAVLRGFSGMLREGRIDVIQFEYGYVNVMTKFLLRDFYSFFGEYGMVIGKIYPNYVDFRDYHQGHEDFLGPNFLAVRSSLSELVELLGE
jgi:FkbM family methyltransferase